MDIHGDSVLFLNSKRLETNVKKDKSIKKIKCQFGSNGTLTTILIKMFTKKFLRSVKNLFHLVPWLRSFQFKWAFNAKKLSSFNGILEIFCNSYQKHQ